MSPLSKAITWGLEFSMLLIALTLVLTLIFAH